jgi:hypothetical protein
MSDATMLVSQLGNLLLGAPMILVQLAGLVLSLANLPKRPRAAALAATAFGGLLALNILGRVLQGLLYRIMMRAESLAFYTTAQGAYAFLSGLLAAAFNGLIVYALFYVKEKKGPEA